MFIHLLYSIYLPVLSFSSSTIFCLLEKVMCDIPLMLGIHRHDFPEEHPELWCSTLL